MFQSLDFYGVFDDLRLLRWTVLVVNCGPIDDSFLSLVINSFGSISINGDDGCESSSSLFIDDPIGGTFRAGTFRAESASKTTMSHKRIPRSLYALASGEAAKEKRTSQRLMKGIPIGVCRSGDE